MAKDWHYAIADNLMTLANWLIAGIVVGLIVKKPEGSLTLALIGAVALVDLYGFSLWLMGRAPKVKSGE